MDGVAGSQPELRVEYVETVVRGRYLLRPGRGAGLLVGFHGYAENAADQLERLARLPEAEGWDLCSIQALHPFYTRVDGEVVASWLTSLDREHALKNNLHYLNRILEQVQHGDVAAVSPLVFSGFSQGAAMAWRAACRFGCCGVVAVGSEIPLELGPEALASVPAAMLARGRNDRKYPLEKLESDVGRLSVAGVRVEVAEFSGGHLWTQELDPYLSGFLARIARGKSVVEAEIGTRE